ncbi:MAG: hypothetical protein Q4G35_08290 [Propionibacteriaceae bacterium]|nr:hypothetical protein [Propionibacteriaceae bacterium]
MSALVKLSSKLPGDEEINGLDAIADELQEETTIVALVWISPREVRRVIATGNRVPIVEIRRIEPLGEPSDLPAELVQLVLDQQAQRTGRTPLPIDQVTVPAGSVDELDDKPPAHTQRPASEPTPIREDLGSVFSDGTK